ncbi:hypothetical protein E2C01_007197 [Portunus trituberculatus]|uniref:Uncharacterized protein n=1 Tax=Portunus trituberculatus TaxID=210409 RepID=A0A5B7CYB3_PORTR|nr:hypothetical protein [Portunus trituberculatus]
MGEIRPPLTKMVLNNFVVQKRPVVRQAKIHIINGLVHSTRRLRKKMEKDEGQCNKLEAKADRLVKEVLFIKCNDTVNYTCLTLSHKLKLIFERQEVVLLRAEECRLGRE